MYTGINRLAIATKDYEKKIAGIGADKIASLEKTATADGEELCAYQNHQAKAHAMGKISTEEAQWLYNIFGRECPTAEHFNSQPLAARCVAISAIMEAW